MATKAQKRTQKARRKQKKRRREQQRAKKRQVSPATRLAQRVGKQVPQSWSGELKEDVALFDDRILAELSVESQNHADLIRNSLAGVCRREGARALEPLNEISRRSLYSEWRLFLRGLVDWLGQEVSSAKEAWARLDKERRPARIAQAFLLSHRDDLGDLRSRQGGQALEQATGNVDQDDMIDHQDLDQELVDHATLVRKFQMDRIAIRKARAITEIPFVVEDAMVNPEHIAWLRNFTTEFDSWEPDLVQSLHEVTVRRAFCGHYVDMFENAAKFFRGPKFDPRNNLLRYFSEAAHDDRKAQQYLDKYLNVDLPNTDFAPELCAAIQSTVHMVIAADELAGQPDDPMGGMFLMFDSGPNLDFVEHHLNEAVKAFSKNREAWQGLQALLQDELSNDRMKKAEREEILKRLADVQQRWVKALPDDIEPRLALVDYLLEHDRSDDAKLHVKWLAGTRRDDPIADAMDWKLSLLEAMRLCRRKTWHSQATEHLDQAAVKWPDWLSNDWLPYLRAAVSLRGGNSSAMDELREQDTEASIDPTAACMILGAAQRMRVPAAELKPLRKLVSDGVDRLSSLSLEGLFRAASFFWDLERARLKYPAYRMHGTKFLWELYERIEKQPTLVTKNLDSEHVRNALLIMTHEGMLNDRYSVRFPDWLVALDDEHAVAAAIKVTACLRCRVDWRIGEFAHLTEPLRIAANKEDTFYRHFYNQLADDLEDRVRASQKSGFGMMPKLFGDFAADECDCADCRAARGEEI